MSGASRRRADEVIAARAAGLARGRTVVAAYAPMPGEPGGPGLLDALAAVADTVLLPIVLPDLDLDWTAYRRSDRPADTGAGGEPHQPAHPRLGTGALARAEVVLVPALGVDLAGIRLGRGGGSFDRALARVPPGTPIVALLYQGELRDRLPLEPHDRPVTAVITPAGLIQLGPTGDRGGHGFGPETGRRGRR